MNHAEQAWEMYLSTGIDPTGGDIGPDFDLETGEYLQDDDESAERAEGMATEELLDELILKLERITRM